MEVAFWIAVISLVVAIIYDGLLGYRLAKTRDEYERDYGEKLPKV